MLTSSAGRPRLPAARAASARSRAGRSPARAASFSSISVPIVASPIAAVRLRTAPSRSPLFGASAGAPAESDRRPAMRDGSKIRAARNARIVASPPPHRRGRKAGMHYRERALAPVASSKAAPLPARNLASAPIAAVDPETEARAGWRQAGADRHEIAGNRSGVGV